MMDVSDVVCTSGQIANFFIFAGWPSFSDVISAKNVVLVHDPDLAERHRIEVKCAKVQVLYLFTGLARRVKAYL